MNKTAPWNIRGVGLDTREAAREAARRAGLSLGEWLDSVIAEEAAGLGIEADDIDADDRLEAVTAKLSRMAGAPAAARKTGRAASSGTSSAPQVRPNSARHERFIGDSDDFDDARPYGVEHGRVERFNDAGPMPQRKVSSPLDAEAILDAAVARIEQRAHESQRQTNEALENVALRLGDLETHMTTRRDDDAIQPIKSALGRLEERIESLSRRPAQPRTDARVEASLRDLTERLDEVGHKIDRSAQPKSNPAESAHLQRLDARLASLMNQLSESEARRARAVDVERVRAEQAERARAAEAERAERLRQAEAQRARAAEGERLRLFEAERARAAEAEQRALEAERARAAEAEQRALEAERARAAEAEQRAAEAEARAARQRRPARPLRGIAHDLLDESVSAVERRQRDLDGQVRQPASDPAIDQRLDQIVTRIEKVADSAGGRNRESDAAYNNLHDEIARLAARLDEMRSDAHKAPEAPPELLQLKRDIADMSQAVRELAPRGSVSALEAAVRDLASRIEVSRQDGARENLLAPVETLVKDLQKTLKTFDPRATVNALEGEIKAIGRKVETMTATGFDPEAFKRIHSQSQEIRDLLTAAAARPMPVEKIERQIAALGARVEHLAVATSKAPQPDVSSAIGEIRTMFDRAMVDRAAPSQYIATLEKRLESLALKIDQAVAKPAPPVTAVADTSGLERMMTGLAERIESARATTQDPRIFEQLQKQITEINQRLNRPDGNAKTLSAIERSIGDLFDGLEKTRAAAISAAETAARSAATEAADRAARSAATEAAEKAARASLREAMQNLPQAIDTAPRTEAIQRDLIDIRAEQEAASQRAHATLNAVHGTLEKIVGRLATIEAGHGNKGGHLDIEATRKVAAEAARLAATDTLAEALRHFPTSSSTMADAQALQRGLVELRAEHESAGRSAHATLSAVHGTLEKIVDRLATIEAARDAKGEHLDIEATRKVAADAARLAATDTLSEALRHFPTSSSTMADAQALQRGLVELRAEHESAGRNAHATLSALHGTLEKVVDRLAMIEDMQPKLTARVRDEAKQLAAEAARNAALETLEDTLQRLPAPHDPADAHLIKQDIADLRLLQEDAGERTHSTLRAVHATLEKVVDRLSALEDERAATLRGSGEELASPAFAPAPRRFEMVVDPDTLRPRATPRAAEPTLAGEATLVAPAAATQPTPLPVSVARIPAALVPAPPAPPFSGNLGGMEGSDALLEPGTVVPRHRGATSPPRAAARHANPPAQPDMPAPTASALDAVADATPTPGSFIAAARRAAQAAATEAAAAEVAAAKPAKAQRKSAQGNGAAGEEKFAIPSAARISLARNFVAARSRPILIGLTGLALVLSTAMLLRSLLAPPPMMQKSEIAPQEFAIPAAPAAAPEKDVARAVIASVPPDTLVPPGAGRPRPSNLPPAPNASIPGDVAASTLARGRQPIAGATPPDLSMPAIAAPPARTAARPAGIDPVPTGSIDSKAGSDPALNAIGIGLREAAMAGNSAAQYEIGLRFAEGRSVARDLASAAHWFGKAADQGLAPAQYRIGSLYEKGLGVARDAALAKSWYQRAAEAGNIRAMHNLAVLTAEGGGGKPDYASAAQWFKKAAEHGVRDSQYNLAILYARGLGIEQNLGQSYVWFAIAAAQGDEDAMKKRDEVAAKLEGKALSLAKATVDAFRPQAAAASANDLPAAPASWDAAPQKAGAVAKPGDKLSNL